MKRSIIKDRNINSKNIDVRPLDKRESPLNTRKGMFTRKHSAQMTPDAKEQLFFIDQTGPHELDENLPAYIRNRAKYGL
jgi:hypothetical protein